MSEIVLNDSDNGSTVTVSAGSLITVRVPEIPGTGFRWQIEQQDTALLDFQVVGSGSWSTNDGVPGAVGMHDFIFRAVQEGFTELRLKLVNEGPGFSVGNYSVTLQIF